MGNDAMQETESTKRFPVSLSELSERSNNLVMKLRMECKQPALADDLRGLFDQYAWVVRLHQLAAEESADRREVADLQFAHETLAATSPDMMDVVHFAADVEKFSPRLATTARQLLTMLTCGQVDESAFYLDQPEDTPNSVDYTASKPMPNTWRKVQRDHEILLALVRGYRFLLEADDRTLRHHRMTRLKLIRSIRGIEVRAAAKGTVV
jgi:hypothetical protein